MVSIRPFWINALKINLDINWLAQERELEYKRSITDLSILIVMIKYINAFMLCPFSNRRMKI